jgi:hypothetical protein
MFTVTAFAAMPFDDDFDVYVPGTPEGRGDRPMPTLPTSLVTGPGEGPTGVLNPWCAYCDRRPSLRELAACESLRLKSDLMAPYRRLTAGCKLSNFPERRLWEVQFDAQFNVIWIDGFTPAGAWVIIRCAFDYLSR